MSNTISAKIIKALGIFSGVQFTGMLCSIVRTKLISIWIGEAGVGLFAIYNSVIDLVSSGTLLNLGQSAVRDISMSQGSKLAHIAGVVRWWGTKLGLLGAALMLILSPLLSYISFDNIDNWWAFAILSIAVFTLAYSTAERALMQGTNKFKQMAHCTMTGAIVGTTLSIPLYYFWGLKSIIPSILIFYLTTALATRHFKDTQSTRNARADNIKSGIGFLKLGFYLTISSVVTTAASYAFISYMNRTASTSDVGLYQSGYTLIIRYTGILFTALSMEYFPRISKVAMRPYITSKLVSHELIIILYILTPLLVLFVAADQLAILILYKESFLAMLPFVTIGIGGMIFRAVSYCMAYVIISRGDGRTYIVTEVLSSAIGLALNITLYHYWSFVGLGVSYVLWYIIYTIITGVVYHKYNMSLSSGAIKLSIASVVLVFAAIVLKQYGWWAVMPVFIISCALSYYGYRILFKRKRRKSTSND